MSRAPAFPTGRVAVTAARIVTIALLLSLSAASLATTYRLLSPGETVAAADLVFTARVVDVVAGRLESKALASVYTTVTLEIDELIRGYGVGEPSGSDDGQGSQGNESDDELGPGEPIPEVVELDFLGGDAGGDRRLVVAGSPSWQTGETVLVAAYDDPDLASPLVGFRQGMWRLVGDAFLDQDGVALGVDAAGRLTRTDLPGAPAEVLAAVRAVVAGEEPPATAEEAPPAGDQAESEAGEEASAPPQETPEAEPGDQEGEEEDASASDAGQAEDPDDEAVDAPGARPEDRPGEGQGAPGRTVTASYRVDEGAISPPLADAVEQAASAWRALGTDAVELLEEGSSSNTFAYGEQALFGPDTYSLTLVDDAGAVNALLSPAAGAALDSAIQHELGLLLGLPASEDGVMAMAVGSSESEAAPRAPGDLELRALLATTRYAPADLSQDGVVDFADLLEFAAHYGRSGLNLPGDLDGDGDVDDDDLSLLREAYEFTPPQRP